jgi:hypothetical protein
MSNRLREKKLFLERLEDRSLMAGIVDVFTNVAGELQLIARGTALDTTAHGVMLTFVSNSGSMNTYRISSTNTGTPNDTGTQFSLNGTGPLVSTLTISNIPNMFDLYVNLKNGDDKFVYNQSAPVTNTAINFRDAALDLGFGQKDQLEVTFLRVSRDLKIWGGQPGTPPQLQSPVISLGRGGFNSVGRDFGYYGGNGNDDITILATTIARDVRRPPDPANYRNACPAEPMFLNDGNDKLTIGNSPTGPVTVGLPTSTATNSIFRLDGGGGNDSISVTGMTVNVIDWNLDDRNVDTVVGDDTVFFQSTTIRWNSTVDGGPGYDIHTESNSNPRNNFKDENGNFILDSSPSDTTTPPFTNPPRQGTATNPNGAEMRFVNFENGQTRPPGSGGSGGGGGGGGGGGARWNYRRDESVVVSTANSSTLTSLVTLLANSEHVDNTEPSVTVVNDRLLISGTKENDLILIADAGNGRVRVRAGHRILGTFYIGQGIAVETLSGNDFVYVAPTIPVSTMVSATATSDRIMGGMNLLLLDNGVVYSNQQAAEHPHFVLEQNAAAQDMALLQILGLPSDTNDIWSIFRNPI